MRTPIEIAGSRVLVAGGSGVLGGEIARLLVEDGASVALAGRNEARLSERALSLGGVPTFTFDLQSRYNTTEAVDYAADTLGGLDGLVNAAGVVAFGPFSDLTDETLEQLIAVNLTGPLRMIRAALPHMEGGFVVNISGVVAESPTAGLTAYSAAKAGISAASSALTRELRRQGIRMLDARPPHTETGLASRAIEGTAPNMPPGLAPETVAKVIVEGIKSGARELKATDFS